MATVMGMISLVEKLDLEDSTQLALEDTRPDVIKLQQDQMFEGEGSDGKAINPAYKPSTIAIKKRKGQPTNRVTLKDTGSFYRNVFVDVRQEEIIIDSGDNKTEVLLKKYGDKIFGLQDEALGEYTKGAFFKRLRQIITNRTGLSFTK